MERENNQRKTNQCSVSTRRMNSNSNFHYNLQANPDHRVDFHNPQVIGSDNNWRRLQILESLLIQEHKPELNANIPSMPLCILTCNRASCFTHDVTRHHHWRVSSWVMWLRMLLASTSLPKQPYTFFIFLQRFSPEWPIKTCSKITAVLFAMHWWW